MKKIVLAISWLIFLNPFTHAQNVGIGTDDPTNKLHVVGNLLINEPYTSTNIPPTPAQTKTMVNNTTLAFSNADSTGRIFDPGGPMGDYIANLTAYVDIPFFSGSSIGMEFTLENVGLGTGDSLIVRANFPTGPVLLRIGNGYSTPGTWIFSGNAFHLTFKSNSDASAGSGFSLLFHRLHSLSGDIPPLSGSAGKAFFFDTQSGAVRSGNVNADARGLNSVALGNNCTASGVASIALGFGCTATGEAAVAIGLSAQAVGARAISIGSGNYASGYQAMACGSFTTASGGNAVSFGHSTYAIGDYASSFSYLTTASGFASIAMGGNTLASQSYATALGDHTEASGVASTAIGASTTASGTSSLASGQYSDATGTTSTAFGYSTVAGGNYSTAFGSYTHASGSYSTAFGLSTNATGDYSTTFGRLTTASEAVSTAMGFNTTANGPYSTAMGNYVSTTGYNGAFAIGDNSTTTVMQSFVANGFRSRFAGGYRLLSNSAASLGVVLLPDGTSWGVISDVRLKEKFLPVDGEKILHEIASMPLTTWNYIAQTDKTSRHYGPMAQDFFAAFGKDDLGTIGSDTLINQQDFLGVSLVAIQALEKRTAELQDQVTEMLLLLQTYQEQNAILEARNKSLLTEFQSTEK